MKNIVFTRMRHCRRRATATFMIAAGLFFVFPGITVTGPFASIGIDILIPECSVMICP